ncbi:MAG: helix-turn-helix transcriptional regulator [Clostridia bacterium]|nr:helix-turn-helix transcriptional regulator [Clostridia bacterium]
MTTGEKINYYRKQLGLSQEELGQKLLVSRQTISLWEKDQTVPTIDNLIRLKEIFGVSVDELLGCAEENQTEVNLPVAKESYVFRYTKDELETLYKRSNMQLIYRMILCAAFAVGFLVWALFEQEGQWFLGLGAGVMFLSTVIVIKTFSANKSSSKKVIERLPESSYDIKAYDDFFTVKITRNGEIKSDFKFDFNDIEQFLDYGEYLYVTANAITFILRKSELVQNSVFTLLLKSSPEKTVVNKKGMTTTQIVLNLLFVATFFSEFIAMLIMMLIPGELTWHESCWPFFVAMPIPIASLIMGIIFKAKGYKCTKNIVVGVIFTLILGAFGFAPYMAEDIADHTDAAVINAEQIIGIDIPKAEGINTYYWTDEDQYEDTEYIHSSSDIWFEDNQADEFEKALPSDERWISKIPNNLFGLSSSFTEIDIYDYIILYNADTNQFNTVPDENGRYYFYFIGYDCESNTMKIDEYDIEYIK